MKHARNVHSNIISEEVVLAEYQAVYRYMLTVCRNEHEAEEVTQEAFFRAMKANDFRGDGSIYSWLCSIARHIWLNKYKKKRRETAFDDMEQSSTVPSLEEQLVDKDMSLQIYRVLHEIEEPYKEVFSLRVFGELSFKDIAGLFGKTESWGRVTFHRAKKMIVEKLRKEGWL